MKNTVYKMYMQNRISNMTDYVANAYINEDSAP